MIRIDLYCSKTLRKNSSSFVDNYSPDIVTFWKLVTKTRGHSVSRKGWGEEVYRLEGGNREERHEADASFQDLGVSHPAGSLRPVN